MRLVLDIKIGRGKMYLFFDTETTGLPKNWNAPVSNSDNWPRLVQIAWLQCDDSGKKILKQCHIIKPDNFEIPVNAVEVHGISNEKAHEVGIPLKKVLSEFSTVLKSSELLIAHNIRFDEKVIGSEFIRTKIKNNLCSINKICTMQSTTDFCQIPGNYGYKWPSLPELHQKLFSSTFDNAHNALSDVSACAKCFFELKKRKIIKI